MAGEYLAAAVMRSIVAAVRARANAVCLLMRWWATDPRLALMANCLPGRGSGPVHTYLTPLPISPPDGSGRRSADGRCSNRLSQTFIVAVR